MLPSDLWSCAPGFSVSPNTTVLQNVLEFTLGIVTSDDESDVCSFMAGVYCAASNVTDCLGICPNADVSGKGVRIAFWLSSVLQAILVSISPEESSAAAWAAAVLTASVTIPALTQKNAHTLTLYHANLVLNFATFSALTSLSVAPMCSVWRETGSDQAEHDEDDCVLGEESEQIDFDADAHLRILPRRRVHRERLSISLALLIQVSLQWTWAIMMFTSTEYAQSACSPSTRIILFGKIWTVQDINNERYFVVWPLWLLFCMGLTLVWGALLTFSSSREVHPVLSRHSSRVADVNASLLVSMIGDVLPFGDRRRLALLVGNFLAFVFSLFLLVVSELQVKVNNVLPGENTWAFGQVAALMLALVPAWPIVMGLDRKYREMTKSTSCANNTKADEACVVGHDERDIIVRTLDYGDLESSAGRSMEDFDMDRLQGTSSSYDFSVSKDCVHR